MGRFILPAFLVQSIGAFGFATYANGVHPIAFATILLIGSLIAALVLSELAAAEARKPRTAEDPSLDTLAARLNAARERDFRRACDAKSDGFLDNVRALGGLSAVSVTGLPVKALDWFLRPAERGQPLRGEA